MDRNDDDDDVHLKLNRFPLKLDGVYEKINSDLIENHKLLECLDKIIGIIGDTGSGKSTLGNILCGIPFEVINGAVVFTGEIIFKNTEGAFSSIHSETSLPKYLLAEPVTFTETYSLGKIYDFGGFKDTRG